MRETIDYSMRHKILAGRVQYANRVAQEQLINIGQRLSYSVSHPDKQVSILPALSDGKVSTTPEEVAEYISQLNIPLPGSIPSTPTALSIVSGNEHIEITFTQLSDGGQPILNYEYSLNGAGFVGFSPSQTSTPLIISGLTNGTSYSVQIRAVNVHGPSGASESAIGTPSGTEIFTQFTSVGTFSWTAPTWTTSVTYLVVAGGGGSGGGYDTGAGGGGGAGEVLSGVTPVIGGTTYTVIVGDGGIAGISIRSPVSETSGGNGGPSVFGALTANGGYGGYGSRNQTGGSGAGGAQVVAGSGGGAGRGGGSNGGGGGGGGNSGAGGNKSGTTAGSGGAGVSNSITGSAVTYGAGGAGGTGNFTNAGVAGASNTGNGAKGGGNISGQQMNGAKGGSGYVALRYYQ